MTPIHTIGLDIGSGAVKSVLFRHDDHGPHWLAKRCERIRSRDPMALAQLVLRHTPGDWSTQRIAALMAGPATTRVVLSEPVPVMILYATAVTDDAAKVEHAS